MRMLFGMVLAVAVAFAPCGAACADGAPVAAQPIASAVLSVDDVPLPPPVDAANAAALCAMGCATEASAVSTSTWVLIGVVVVVVAVAASSGGGGGGGY